MVERIEARFPGLRTSPIRVTSPATRDYNCIAWAAGDTTRWWWPDPDGEDDATYWPPRIANEETVDAFIAAFATLGYAPSSGVDREVGFERIARFTRGEVPTHAARQLHSGRWTSKLGQREDIDHDLQAVGGGEYGAVFLILKRPITA